MGLTLRSSTLDQQPPPLFNATPPASSTCPSNIPIRSSQWEHLGDRFAGGTVTAGLLSTIPMPMVWRTLRLLWLQRAWSSTAAFSTRRDRPLQISAQLAHHVVSISTDATQGSR